MGSCCTSDSAHTIKVNRKRNSEGVQVDPNYQGKPADKPLSAEEVHLFYLIH